ncbi:MAG: hypothetical protein ACREXI_15680 [Caldimonas sp.]
MLAAAFAVGAWWLLPETETAAPVAAEVAPAERFVASWSASLASAKRAPRGPQTGAVAALPPARKASEVEVCGVGIIDLASPEGAAQLERASDDAEVAVPRLVRAMQDSGDERVRALGLYMGAGFAGAQAARDATPPPADCAADEACRQRYDAASMDSYAAGARPLTDTLARAASTTRDPMVYAVAMQACLRATMPGRGRPGTCQLISAEQWARLDPDNAVAWLQVAASARSRGDAEAEAEALLRVGSARESRLYGDRLPAMALALLPSEVPPLERLQIEAELVGVFAAWTYPDYQNATRYCSVEAMRDANRRQDCDAIASSLVTHGSTLIEQAIGKAIGTRAGWSDERIDAAKSDFDAARMIQERIFPTGDEMYACRSIAQMRTYLGRLAQGGEVGAARLAIEESGSTTADLAREYRVIAERSKREAETRAAADQAASAAASAASSGS